MVSNASDVLSNKSFFDASTINVQYWEITIDIDRLDAHSYIESTTDKSLK